MKEFLVLSPTAILGYGFPLSSFKEGLSRLPDAIAVDAGSTDPGPYYLGAGEPFTGRNAVKRDLNYLLEAAAANKIPLLIGSAGGSGGEPHLKRDVDLIMEIAGQKDLHFRMAVIHAEVEREKVRDSLYRNKIKPLGPVPPLQEKDLDEAVRIVGQMGVEPLAGALEAGAQVVIAGRAYDPSVFAAPACQSGYRPGPAIHMGKILECGAIASTPGSGSDCLLGRIGAGYFEVETLNPARVCTVTSVAAHTLYEKSDPVYLPLPGGCLDLKRTRYEQVAENRVRVTGSKFIPAQKYTVKLEGVKKAGFRTVTIAGCRDPVMISEIDQVMEIVKERTRDNFAGTGSDYSLSFKIYGKNGVMGDLEPVRDAVPHEIGIIIEVIGKNQETADTICGFARSTMLHCSYPGRTATAGNLAFPFSPAEFRGGEVFNYNIYHLMEVADPFELFPMEIINV
ncbi:MAG: acyclic terpene utilization AtuA family protein [Desulfotomaculaceae bacterium]|nr:acyclic terpene utilization AtuA family protein [Desulfotomaculaceae bacterium]MDD4766171.1 acyclic terpene utilization AtuA family protein [Desulfotomaculaceae bacterium]